MIVTHNEFIMKEVGDSGVEGCFSLIVEDCVVENKNFYAIATTRVSSYSEMRLVLKSVWKELNAENKQVFSRSERVDLSALFCVCVVHLCLFMYE